MSSIRKILVDTTVDITCPFCMMSSHQLQLALDEFRSEQPNTQIEVKVHPFLLDPTASDEPRPVQEVMAAKFGEQKAGEIRGMMKGKFEAMGLELNQKLASSTVRSHRLIAKTPITSQFPLALELMKAYHTAGKAPSDINVLASTAVKNRVFKDETAAKEFINSDELEQTVRDEAKRAKEEQGVGTVPHYSFQGEAKPGSKSTEEFLELFKQYAA